jgi:mxaA protein
MRLALLAWLAVWILVSSGPARAQIVSVTLQPPSRDFGLFVGDMLTSTAVITVLPGTVLNRESLPPAGPVSPIADVRRVELDGTATHIEMRVTYQEFFAPDQVLAAEIPGYSVVFSAQGKRMVAAVPGFRFTASPFRHDLQPTLDPVAMRPDHPVRTEAAPGATWAIAAGMLLMAAGAMALSWPWATLRRPGPFQAAASHYARHKAGYPGRDVFVALHRAFDITVGRHVFAEDIDDFLAVRPHFLPLRDRIEKFFAASQDMFFGNADCTIDSAEWVALCHGLARAERRG